MTHLKKQSRLLFLYLISIVGLVFYLYGFFPFKGSRELTLDSRRSEHRSRFPRLVDKLALIVIDALRYDFVTPVNMPFTANSILNNQSCLVTTKAHSPTVTMPRLKAITSGAISTYIDVILNLMSSHFEQDNFINRASSKGLKLVFYGDDTWLKLFPKAFTRSEGTNSFFTLDYTEVDNNVTRHINDEFKKSDWDVIILHYLGLDHIGHTEGPKSALVKPKLKEMDYIIKQFHDHFKQLEEKENLKAMIIVTGDHGMKDSGSHGGVTYPEIHVPLISVGKPCIALPGWPEGHLPLQIDLASSLSAMLGLPIPVNNMGKIIPSLFHWVKRKEIVDYLELNRLQLSKFESLPLKSEECESLKTLLGGLSNKSGEEVEKVVIEKYFGCLNQFSQELVNQSSDFKVPYLILGVILLWVSLLILVYHGLNDFTMPRKMSHWFLIFGTTLHSVSFASTSFIEEEHQTWYFFWLTFCVMILLESLNQEKIWKMQVLVANFLPWIFVTFIHRFLRKLNQTGDKWAFLPDLKSYFYSEEGQTWLLVIFLLGMGLLLCCAVIENCSKYQLISFCSCLLAVIFYRFSSGSLIAKSVMSYPLFRTYSVPVFWTSLGVFSILTLSRKHPAYLIWLALSSLLLRPHNVILLPVEVVVSKQIHKHYFKEEEQLWNSVAHVWLGYLFYFYQGNGNSLANIDVASGFVGIQEYNPVYAGIMMVAHTYNSFILAFVLSPKSNFVFSVARLMPLTLYCTFLLFQLHHLFIWSVFSPKLLYEASLTLVFMLSMFLNYLKIILNITIPVKQNGASKLH